LSEIDREVKVRVDIRIAQKFIIGGLFGLINGRLVHDPVIELDGSLALVQTAHLVQVFLHAIDLVRAWNNLGWDLCLQVRDVDHLVMAQPARDKGEQARVIVNIIHGCIEASTTLDDSGTSLHFFAHFPLFNRLLTHVGELTRVELPIVHLFYQLADLGLALDNFESCFLIAQGELLQLIGCHNGVLAAEFGR